MFLYYPQETYFLAAQPDHGVYSTMKLKQGTTELPKDIKMNKMDYRIKKMKRV